MKIYFTIKIISLAVFLFIFTACQSDRRLSVMDQAGENRTELEKVLQHYKDDAQKLKAAEFLMENMDAHYTLESPAISRFRQDVDSLYGTISSKMWSSMSMLTMHYLGNTI